MVKTQKCQLTNAGTDEKEQTKKSKYQNVVTAAHKNRHPYEEKTRRAKIPFAIVTLLPPPRKTPEKKQKHVLGIGM